MWTEQSQVLRFPYMKQSLSLPHFPSPLFISVKSVLRLFVVYVKEQSHFYQFYSHSLHANQVTNLILSNRIFSNYQFNLAINMADLDSLGSGEEYHLPK